MTKPNRLQAVTARDDHDRPTRPAPAPNHPTQPAPAYAACRAAAERELARAPCHRERRSEHPASVERMLTRAALRTDARTQQALARLRDELTAPNALRPAVELDVDALFSEGM